MRRLITAALAVCAACGPVDEAEEATPRIPLSTPDTATVTQELRRDDDGIIIMNGLDPVVLGENYLLNNETHRTLLVSRPLITATFASGGALYPAVRDDQRSVEVLKYVVRCALGPTDAPVVARGQTLRGEAGLCRAWASGAPDLTCQRKVSACLFALSNVVGVHVPVSLRGAEASLSAAPEVRPYSMTPAGTPHEVLNGCGAVATAGVRHNCGWQPVDDAAAEAAGIAKIFACTPGSTVRVGAGSACSGTTLGSMSAGSDKVLRVCAGIGPCRGPTAGEPTPPGFVGQAQNDSCGTIKPEVIFSCPAEGRYVVLQRDYYIPATPRTPGTMVVGQLGSLGAASEASIFRSREGAFFGSLFSGPLGRTVTWNNLTQSLDTTITGPTVFPGAFSCEDALYTNELAYRSARLCSLSEGQCLTTWTGVCQGDTSSPRVCDGITSPVASGAFFACWSPAPGAVKYDEGLTTFLRTPCDLIGGSAACKQAN